MIEQRIEVNIAGGLDIPLPRMANVRQKFEATRLPDITAGISAQFKRPEVRGRIKPGQSHRGRLRQPRHRQYRRDCASAVIRELQALGAKPFMFPGDGQPRRRHRRGPEEGAGELWHHRGVHRRADQGQHGDA